MKKDLPISAFTLIELMVVMGIISILAAMSLFALQGARESGRDAKRKGDLELIRSGIELYKADCRNYPIPGTSGDFTTRFGVDLSGADGSCGVSGNSNTYISENPSDPVTGRNYYYESNGTTYILCTALENVTAQDSACPTTGSVCGASVNCSYHVRNP
ncbi:hypothetical protein A2Z22_00210 [Candidatus Woesebacteria bacterium RBG_16_34_12]|uniref:Type II secretion system protein GspG C-terminal domain-containing protein n=1 Tax=Candidatus Woesebacteria bacterium RBG_16_34_12 TaxID=1802480 RepID=A0A1F7X9L2_9BACT|nr:MAG: hypothetical protein A2Z22_00210 [Candidatus Woesebacteria bacterium RBG_16_34_12]